MNKFNKKGFTLSEALIALAIVGVVSAALLPLINKSMPDAEKVLYLKTYDAIVNSTQSIATNTEFYPMFNAGDTIIYENYPLYNSIAKTVDGVTYSGGNKYCQVLATAFNATNPTCAIGYPANPTFAQNDISFSSQNGVDFWVYTTSGIAGSNVTYESDIYIDVNGVEKGRNCMYSEACPNPDRFKLMVASDGKIVAADPKGQIYLKKRGNYMLNRDEEPDGEMLAILPNVDYSKPIARLNEDDGGGGAETPSEPETPEIVLPAGQSWATWVNVASLRTTSVPGIYCEQHNPSRPPGDYSNQRHVYWHQEAGAWVELDGVYYVSGDSGYPPYDGDDAGSILRW